MTASQKHKTLLGKVAKTLPKKATAAQKKFIDTLCSRIEDDDLSMFSAEELGTMALSHYELCKKRVPGKPRISIYCPVVKKAKRRKTFIDIVSDDLAFLVDSAAAVVNKNNHLISMLAHPVVYTAYDGKGNLKDISLKSEEGRLRQSHIHIQIQEKMTDEAIASLEDDLYEALEDVFIANQDWKAMMNKIKEASEELARAKTNHSPKEISKFCDFLDYLHDNNFTFLGFREYEFVNKDGALKSKIVKSSGLGLLSGDVKPAYISENKEGLPRNLQELRRNLPPVSISKTNRVATVHRRVPMDAIAIKTYDENGRVKGEKLFIGLFTSVTYSRSVSDVPYLREKVEETLERTDFIPGSHNRKALRHILEKYPRDELFQIPISELLKTSLSILRLQEHQRIALYMRRDPFGRYISCLVYIPRDRFGTSLRMKIVNILEEELGGECANFYTSMDDALFARVMCIINVSQKKPPEYDVREIEKMVQDAGKTWAERLSEALFKAYEDDEVFLNLSHKYQDAFPISYSSQYRAKQAIFDIKKIEEALETGRLAVDLYRPEKSQPHELKLKVYNPGAPLTLSDVMPILDHMGLRALAELPFEIKPDGTGQSVWIHDFHLNMADTEDTINIPDVKKNFESALIKIWHNETESDGLSALLLSAKANWHEITILRAYIRYMRQIRVPFSRPYIEKAFTENPKLSRMMIDLFKSYHDPSRNKDREKSVKKGTDAIIEGLKKVDSLDQDRIINQMKTLIEATMRTNYYQREEGGRAKKYLSIKLHSKSIPEMPAPKPFMEIFVYSPRVEGVHLRGDKIARGGLRWSDRHEDFRTEVLGLMKAQMVKNAVIVPMGSKGGFVVKKETKSREEFQKEGIECYKIFIRGLLDITDNRKGNKVIPPKDVVRRDDDDPYLVVAADKGTATFSDIANGLSQEYGFWLDDAFASGGSAGYDHKKMGITARGAWESVKLHFRQLNHDTQTQPFDVVGVGDMGGDVFGNGMLLSKHIRLVGAFNHLHIFCDPDPDPESSYKERKRLFDDVKGWDAYDASLLSKGGKIYSRADKQLTLTPEIKKRFDIEDDKVSPIVLIRAMLKARTDLLFFGGIGTYIKSSAETDADAGDKANDALRINAAELRTKVIGEGANLGITQLGRIEFSTKGGKINTDFLDNSGGVDSSDHEVNIKILLSDVMSKSKYKMDLAARNKLLGQMTNEIAEHVLRNNYQQAQAISLAELQASEKLQIHEALIQDLEKNDGLDRKIEGLPSEEQIQDRLRTGKGLTRPELCVLLSYAKINFTQDLMASDVPESPDMQEWLINYYPDILGERYKKEIFDHRLRREMVATMMANSLINRMGPTFIKEKAGKTGASCEDIAKAYIIVREAFNLRELWDQIEALDNKVPAEVQLRAMRDIANLAEHAISWFLTRLTRDLDIGKDIETFGGGVKELNKNMDKLVTPELKESIKQRTQSGERDGLPAKLAHDIALMPVLSSACDIIRIAEEHKFDLPGTAKIYYALGERFHFYWLRQQARFMSSDDHWHSEAKTGLIDQLYSCQAGLTLRIIKDTDSKATDPLQDWLQTHANRVCQLDPLFAELKRVGTIDLPMLIIAEQRLHQLYAG